MDMNRDFIEAEALLKDLLQSLAPKPPRDSVEGQPAYDRWEEDLHDWEGMIHQLVWHLVQAAGAEGRAVVR